MKALIFIVIIFLIKGRFNIFPSTLPAAHPQCVYEAPDKCSADGDTRERTCCEKVADGAPPQTKISISVGFIMLLLSVMVAM